MCRKRLDQNPLRLTPSALRAHEHQHAHDPRPEQLPDREQDLGAGMQRLLDTSEALARTYSPVANRNLSVPLTNAQDTSRLAPSPQPSISTVLASQVNAGGSPLKAQKSLVSDNDVSARPKTAPELQTVVPPSPAPETTTITAKPELSRRPSHSRNKSDDLKHVIQDIRTCTPEPQGAANTTSNAPAMSKQISSRLSSTSTLGGRPGKPLMRRHTFAPGDATVRTFESMAELHDGVASFPDSHIIAHVTNEERGHFIVLSPRSSQLGLAPAPPQPLQQTISHGSSLALSTDEDSVHTPLPASKRMTRVSQRSVLSTVSATSLLSSEGKAQAPCSPVIDGDSNVPSPRTPRPSTRLSALGPSTFVLPESTSASVQDVQPVTPPNIVAIPAVDQTRTVRTKRRLPPAPAAPSTVAKAPTPALSPVPATASPDPPATVTKTRPRRLPPTPHVPTPRGPSVCYYFISSLQCHTFIL
jgi:hypothetical protein